MLKQKNSVCGAYIYFGRAEKEKKGREHFEILGLMRVVETDAITRHRIL
jgi:hypothetical protein